MISHKSHKLVVISLQSNAVGLMFFLFSFVSLLVCSFFLRSFHAVLNEKMMGGKDLRRDESRQALGKEGFGASLWVSVSLASNMI